MPTRTYHYDEKLGRVVEKVSTKNYSATPCFFHTKTSYASDGSRMEKQMSVAHIRDIRERRVKRPCT